MKPYIRKLIIITNRALPLWTIAMYVRFYTKNTKAGLDFHCYYYAGNLIRQGMNPYQAFLDRALL